MDNKIIGREFPLSDIFSKKFAYYIPGYQRPYAWSEKETGELFDDIYEAYSSDNNEAYFLGSIVLVKKEDIPHADVIDGQQRLTTLTILFSVISTYLSGVNKITWNDYLMEKGNEFENIPSEPRLHLRERDQQFFNKYIQNVNLDELGKADDTELDTESKKHIKRNFEVLKDRMMDCFSDNEKPIIDFGKFLISHCYMIAVSTPTQQSAFRVFSILNDRGMNLLPIDIIKAKVIGLVPDADQKEYTDKWEDMEAQTTRQGFNDVIIHTRMIFAKTKAKENIIDEFEKYVISRFNPKELIDQVLEPFSNAYITLVNRNYVSSKNAEEINYYLYWLKKIDNSDWMPTAIKFFADRKNDSDYILWFVKKFERLAAYLHITGADRRTRIDRFRSVLDEMEKRTDHDINNPLASIELTDKEKQEFMRALDGEIYLLSPMRRNYVILRLNSFLSDGANKFDNDPNILTIEHVLPQTVREGSEWEKLWPNEEEREYWLNRISNLVALTRKKNSAAQNFDFERKKTSYFSNINGVTTYPLTTQVLSESEWVPDVLKKRQKALLEVFQKCWDLKYQNTVRNVIVTPEEECSYISKYGVKAKGKSLNGTFTVFKESEVSYDLSPDFKTKHPKAYKLRTQLEKLGIIKNHKLVKDYRFSNATIAASVILGRGAKNSEWKDKAEGSVNTKRHGNDLSAFDINDEKTYDCLSIGKLAYELIRKLFEEDLIKPDEVELLKGRKYSRSLFSEASYPILAENRDAHRITGKTRRYRVGAIMYQGKPVFVTSQWYEPNRIALIAWYKKHLK